MKSSRPEIPSVLRDTEAEGRRTSWWMHETARLRARVAELEASLEAQPPDAGVSVKSYVKAQERIVELEEATKVPPPEEIEWRVARLCSHAEYLDTQRLGEVGTFIRESAAAFERMARQNEGLKESYDLQSQDIADKANRIRELEIESNDFCQAMRRQAERAAAFREALKGASHALRSYQYDNGSTELAKAQADAIDSLLSVPPSKKEGE